MADYEKQHFLPSSYLKFFSDAPGQYDRASFIWRVDKTTQRRVPANTQCHGKHFYSKINAADAEKYFQKHEVAYDKIVSALLAKREPKEKHMGDLFLCIFDLHLRNAAHENKTGEEGFEAYKDRLTLFLNQMLLGGKQDAFTIQRAKLHIVENWRMEIMRAPDNGQFITSDHPAIIMTCSGNPTATRALQMMILPLTPLHIAIAFDRRIMWLENKTPTSKDLETLNAWQIYNSVNCIYANRELSAEELIACQSHLNNKRGQNSVIDERGWRLHTAYLPVNAHFSFMKLKPPLF